MPRAKKPAASPEAKSIASYDHQAGRANLPTADSADILIPPNQDVPEHLNESSTSPPPQISSETLSFPCLTWQVKTPATQEHRHGPLYVHDKVSPAEILSRLMLRPNERQMGLFADAREAFNGFKREDGAPADNAANEPYRYHNGHWANRLIRATAQRAMRSLLHKEGMAGKVNLVYLDPPYNNSFRSNFAPAANDFAIEEGEKGVPNDPLSIQAYRDTYEDDIHSYLDGLKEQLELAQQLLSEDGSIIVQIGPDNLHYNPPAHYPKEANAYPCPTGKHWSVSHEGLRSIAAQGRIDITKGNQVRFKYYLDEMPGKVLSAIWTGIGRPQNKQYPVETPPRVLERAILMTTSPGDLVLDLTCGSGAMPYQCETWGRRWMAVDVSAVSIAIARDRILTGSYPYHLLKDSEEGHRKDHELNQAMLGTDEPFQPKAVYGNDPAQGFVNERQIRVSAATLAYGPQIPKDIIYHPDRTHQDNRELRAASNFEVCSDSPYRTISPEQTLLPYPNPVDQGVQEQEIENALTRHPLELEPLQVRMATNLASSGISQSGWLRYQVKNLQTTDIPLLTHTGVIVTEDGDEHPAGFYLGKADEIISNTKTRDAAYHASNNGFRYLGVVGFAQDGNAGQVRESFDVTVLNIIANRDLQLDNLKDAKRNNGFAIISEPEVILHRRGETPDGKELVALEVIGINAFDPKRGVVDEPSANRVKAIIVDSCYDGKKFVASHYNVLPTKQNRRAFRELVAAYKGTIDEAALQQMQTCVTVPFPLPEGDEKIAVKVIDQTGVEHMKVIQAPRAAAGRAKPTRPRAKGWRGRQG